MTTPREDWWLIVRRDGVVHCWHIGDTTDEHRDDLITRARVAVGFPPADTWVDGDRSNAVKMTAGEPHPRLLEGAVMHQLSDLDRVTAQQLEAYRAACEATRAGARVQAARTAVQALTTTEREQLYAEVPPPPRTTSGGR